MILIVGFPRFFGYANQPAAKLSLTDIMVGSPQVNQLCGNYAELVLTKKRS